MTKMIITTHLHDSKNLGRMCHKLMIRFTMIAHVYITITIIYNNVK